MRYRVTMSPNCLYGLARHDDCTGEEVIEFARWLWDCFEVRWGVKAEYIEDYLRREYETDLPPPSGDKLFVIKELRAL